MFEWLSKGPETYLGGLLSKTGEKRRLFVERTPVPVGRVFGVAGEDLDPTGGTPDVFGAGRLAVTVVFGKRTLPPGTLLDDGRVFGIGTPFGLGFVCGHGLSLQKDRLGCSNHPGVSTRPEDPVLLTNA